jgi:hypothetical protein
MWKPLRKNCIFKWYETAGTYISFTWSFLIDKFDYQKDRVDFSYKVYGNFANFFESENDLLGFFEFKKGDIVAEIGANKGQNIGGLLLLTDSLTFYAQDIKYAYFKSKKRRQSYPAV